LIAGLHLVFLILSSVSIDEFGLYFEYCRNLIFIKELDLEAIWVS